MKPEFSFKEGVRYNCYVVEAENLVIGDKETIAALHSKLNAVKNRISWDERCREIDFIKTMLGKIQPLDGKVILGDYLEPSYSSRK